MKHPGWWVVARFEPQFVPAPPGRHEHEGRPGYLPEDAEHGYPLLVYRDREQAERAAKNGGDGKFRVVRVEAFGG